MSAFFVSRAASVFRLPRGCRSSLVRAGIVHNPARAGQAFSRGVVISLQYDRSVHLYRLASAGLLAVCALVTLNLIPAFGLSPRAMAPSFDLTQQLKQAAVESVFAAVLALLAAHFREFAFHEGERNAVAFGIKQLTLVRRRRDRLQDLGPSPWVDESDPDGRPKTPAPAAPKDLNLARTRTPSPARFQDVSATDTADLARILESDRLRVSRNDSAQPPATQPARPAPGTASPLSKEDTRALFLALSSGTLKHLGREPTVSELARLVGFTTTAASRRPLPPLILNEALSGSLGIHWSGKDWQFERLKPPAESPDTIISPVEQTNSRLAA